MLFKSPIGTEEERNSHIIWPGTWSDATPYLTKYSLGYHTGADLNNNFSGHWDADAHSPVYAIGDGKVTYAKLFPNPKYWGNIIIIDHGIVDGKPLFTRYGHVEAINVTVGQLVHSSDQIARVGNGQGLFAYHLHFDVSTTDKLRDTAHFWPGQDKKGVETHFVNPRNFLRESHTIQTDVHTDNVRTDNIPSGNISTDIDARKVEQTVWYVISPTGASVHKGPSIYAGKVGTLSRGATLSFNMAEGVNRDSHTWGHINGGEYTGHWVAIGKQDRSETYVSTNPPR